MTDYTEQMRSFARQHRYLSRGACAIAPWGRKHQRLRAVLSILVLPALCALSFVMLRRAGAALIEAETNGDKYHGMTRLAWVDVQVRHSTVLHMMRATCQTLGLPVARWMGMRSD